MQTHQNARKSAHQKCASTRSTLVTHLTRSLTRLMNDYSRSTIKSTNLKESSTNPDSLMAPFCLFFESPFSCEASLQLFRKPTKFNLQKKTKQFNHVNSFSNPSLAKVMSKIDIQIESMTTTLMSCHIT